MLPNAADDASDDVLSSCFFSSSDFDDEDWQVFVSADIPASASDFASSDIVMSGFTSGVNDDPDLSYNNKKIATLIYIIELKRLFNNNENFHFIAYKFNFYAKCN